MTALRWRRALSIAAVAGIAATSLTACGTSSQESPAKRTVLAAIANSLARARDFTFVDHDLATTTTISGEVDDDLRYQMLLNVGGTPTWEEIVRDDAVADYFPNRNAVNTYAGAGNGEEDSLIQPYDQIKSLLPTKIAELTAALYNYALPKPSTLQNSLALESLLAGKWVVDPSGAPAQPTLAQQDAGLTRDPFYEPLTELQALQAEVDALSGFDSVHKFQVGDLTPTYKDTDNPFPNPTAGETEYDLAQQPLPTSALNSSNGIPAPPSNSDLEKTAIYIKDGLVVAIRNDYDVLDRLSDIAKIYRLSLNIPKAAGVEVEEEIGQVTVDLLQGENYDPFRIHEETMLFTYPAKAPTISLPKPAVTTSLSLIPGQGGSTLSTSGGGTVTPSPATTAIATTPAG